MTPVLSGYIKVLPYAFTYLQLVSDGSKVKITATSGVSAAMGFYYFLKTKCDCQFTWAGEQLNVPSTLPVIPVPGLTVKTNDRYELYDLVGLHGSICYFSFLLIKCCFMKWNIHVHSQRHFRDWLVKADTWHEEKQIFSLLKQMVLLKKEIHKIIY